MWKVWEVTRLLQDLVQGDEDYLINTFVECFLDVSAMS